MSDVIIPSIEIFEGGFRFYLYTKSNFKPDQEILSGSVSIVVTLEDDLGNSYVLTSKGGGGSHSPHKGLNTDTSFMENHFILMQNVSP